MDKRIELIEKLKNFDTKYFNQDQKTIAISILENAPYEEVQAYADFLFMKRRTGFTFDYSPEIAKGRLIKLKEDTNRRINVSEQKTIDENKLIIGDNYNALKSLMITHKAKIDIIYIDPPYNTESAKEDGNQSSKEGSASKFIYKDKFGRGGWLNMMKSRLTLAKDLLSDDGVIFVSIDDSEQAYLKVLMDDIFGEENFAGNINWQSSFGGKNDTKLMPVNTEYILVYSFAKFFNKISDIKKESQFKLTDQKLSSTYGKYSTHQLCRQSLTYYTKLDYIIFIKEIDGTYIPLLEDDGDCVGKIIAGPNSMNFKDKWELRNKRISGEHDLNDWRYYWSADSMKLAFEKGFIEIIKKNDEFYIYQKIFEFAKFSGRNKRIEENDQGLSSLRNVISDSKISSKYGNDQIKLIFDKSVFSYPKPTNLLTKLFQIKNKDATILDFFAGSGTTGQAVMELNRQDGGNRKFILCTNNENEIAHNVTYERLYRVIKGESTDGDNNFSWVRNNEPYINAKLRVINIDDKTKISLDQEIDSNIYNEAKEGLKLLDANYNKRDLNLYYDLAALNPLENDEDKFNS